MRTYFFTAKASTKIYFAVQNVCKVFEWCGGYICFRDISASLCRVNGLHQNL